MIMRTSSAMHRQHYQPSLTWACIALLISSCLLLPTRCHAFSLQTTRLPSLSSASKLIHRRSSASSITRLHAAGVAPEDISDKTFDLAVIGAGPVGETTTFPFFHLLVIIIICFRSFPLEELNGRTHVQYYCLHTSSLYSIIIPPSLYFPLPLHMSYISRKQEYQRRYKRRARPTINR